MGRGAGPHSLEKVAEPVFSDLSQSGANAMADGAVEVYGDKPAPTPAPAATPATAAPDAATTSAQGASKAAAPAAKRSSSAGSSVCCAACRLVDAAVSLPDSDRDCLGTGVHDHETARPPDRDTD